MLDEGAARQRRDHLWCSVCGAAELAGGLAAADTPRANYKYLWTTSLLFFIN
jgi:hypothetical protein